MQRLLMTPAIAAVITSAIAINAQAEISILTCVGQINQIETDLDHRVVTLVVSTGGSRYRCRGPANADESTVYFTCDANEYQLDRYTGVLERKITGRWLDWATCKPLRERLF